jgi:hypothetical protein
MNRHSELMLKCLLGVMKPKTELQLYKPESSKKINEKKVLDKKGAFMALIELVMLAWCC